ncbi:hypothetical protein ABK046_46105, partial [Streptomyces caeruleatus]
ISSQAFLVIGYATSMGNATAQSHELIASLLPPTLAILGFVLASQARRSIVAARAAAMRWRQRLLQIIEEHADLAPWRDDADNDELAWRRKAG